MQDSNDENRLYHGTRRTSPQDSWATKTDLDGFCDYYKNLTIDDIANAIDLSEFAEWQAYYNSLRCDLYFVGVKNSAADRLMLPKPYVAPHVGQVFVTSAT